MYNKIHIPRQSAAFECYVRARQLYQWCTRCDEDVVRCHCILMLLLTYAVEPTRCAVHLKYCGKTEYRCGDDVVYIKTGTKPFTQNTYYAYYLEAHLSALHSCLAKESRIFRKPCQINASSTLKKHVSRLYGGTVSLYSTASCF